jgi:hypothetical protein
MTPSVTLSPVSSARNLGVRFDFNLSLSDCISSIIKSRLFHVSDIRRLEPILDQPLLAILLPLSSILSWTIVTHCFSIFLLINLIVISLFLTLLLVLSQILRKCHHITPILKSLHWLEITERIHYKILSITYKCVLSDKPAYLRNLLTVQSTSTICSSSVITLKRPYNPSRLEVPCRSFYRSVPSLWNTLPKKFPQLNSTHSESQPLLSSRHPLNFTRNLKLIFSLLLFLLSLIRA